MVLTVEIKYAHIAEALDHLRRKAELNSVKNAKVDIAVKEEDIGKSEIGSSVTITYEGEFSPASYESIQTKVFRKWTIEIFADHENRPARITLVESREMD